MLKERKKIIGYVLHPYETSFSSGMGYSVLEILRQLAKRAGNYELVIYTSSPVDPMVVPGLYTTVLMPKSFIRKFFFFLFLKEPIDALLFVAPLLPLWLPRKIKPILMCKEITSKQVQYKTYSDSVVAFVRDRVLMPRCIRRAWRVGISSKKTFNDIRAEYPEIALDKLVLVYEGYQEWAHFTPMPDDGWEAMQPFFFFAGRIKKRKNVHGIVNAFVQYKKNTKSDARLVLAGDYGGTYYQDMQNVLEMHTLTKDTFFLSYVTPEQMSWLYSRARVFIFPSFIEGFGMPVVEAMSFGVPCITSKNTPMEEIAQGAAAIIDPHDSGGIAKAMERVWSDEALRAQMIAKGKERAKLYSWDKVGEKYEAIISELTSHAS